MISNLVRKIKTLSPLADAFAVLCAVCTQLYASFYVIGPTAKKSELTEKIAIEKASTQQEERESVTRRAEEERLREELEGLETQARDQETRRRDAVNARLHAQEDIEPARVALRQRQEDLTEVRARLSGVSDLLQRTQSRAQRGYANVRTMLLAEAIDQLLAKCTAAAGALEVDLFGVKPDDDVLISIFQDAKEASMKSDVVLALASDDRRTFGQSLNAVSERLDSSRIEVSSQKQRLKLWGDAFRSAWRAHDFPVNGRGEPTLFLTEGGVENSAADLLAMDTVSKEIESRRISFPTGLGLDGYFHDLLSREMSAAVRARFIR